MRIRWCRAALRRFLRRWGIHVLIGAAAVGGGVASITAVAAWTVLPLFFAASLPAWLLPATLGQALFGSLLVWAMRPMLWPKGWAEAERALPIAARHSRWSDVAVVALALLPWLLLQGAGAATLLAQDPAWLHPHRPLAVVALVSAEVLSVAFGVAVLQLLRRAPRLGAASAASGEARRRTAALPAGFRRIGWPRPLLWWPLWRGPALSCGRILLAGTAVLGLPAGAMARWPGAAGWCLAAFALLALLVVTRANVLARQALAPLFQACAALPLAPARLARGRALLVLLPPAPGALGLLAALPRGGVHTGILAAYALACGLGCVAEALSDPNADASSKSSRWLFTLVLAVTLASEVVA